MRPRIKQIAVFVILLAVSAKAFTAMKQNSDIIDRRQSPTVPQQVRLCMVGDSITWWNHGDLWREYLLDEIPNLAFVGDHTAKHGYSHEGEGGDNVLRILTRMDEIPDCEYYSLLIGTNDSASANQNRDNDLLAKKINDRIIEITKRLLAKPSAKKVFLGSLLPCDLKARPLQTVSNSKVNTLLVEAIKENFPDGNVVFVNYAPHIDDIDKQMCDRLHPSEEGYKILADVLAKTLKEQFDMPQNIPAVEYGAGSGVMVKNLWHRDYKVTRVPLPAGWYTFSFGVHKVHSDSAYVIFKSLNIETNAHISFKMKLEKSEQAKRKHKNHYVFSTTNTEVYIHSQFTIEMHDCEVTQILVEKMRPSKQPSIYSIGSYIDDTTAPSYGEFVEWNAK